MKLITLDSTIPQSNAVCDKNKLILIIYIFFKFDFNNGVHNINLYLYFDHMKQKNIEDVNKKELILIGRSINKYFYALNWRNVIFFNIIQLKYNRTWDEKFL